MKRLPTVASDPDYVIVGQGLAGTLLAWQLHWRGQRPLLLDAEEKCTSSKVAAGIISPITGRYLAKSWRVDEFHPAAMALYARIEKELGAQFYHELPIARLFRDEAEAERWRKRVAKEDLSRYLAEPQPQPLSDSSSFPSPHGGFQMRGSGYLDVPKFLDASRRFFEARGSYRRAELDLSHQIDTTAQQVTLSLDPPIRAKGVVFCQGHRADTENPFFDWIPFKSAKGEILTVRADDIAEARIMNRRVWMLPTGSDYRVGSTYSWDQLDSTPTGTARDEICEKLRGLLATPFDIVDHVAAVRPIINASKALMGRHPSMPSLAYFNGLGSKGVLNGPFLSAMLADHLVAGAPLEPELDVRGN